MAAADHYKTLGVNRDASQEDIQKAYRKLARKYHPDVNPDDKTAKQKFQEVQAAFDVLNDTSKRELYDRYGSSFESMGAGGGGRPGGGWSGTARGGGEDFDFSQFFGERFAGGDPSSAFGDIFSQFRRAEGGGRTRRGGQAARGADVSTELTIPFQTAINGGQVEISLKRPSGQVESIAVKIPAGIDDGKTIRLKGQGEESPGRQRGDLLITIHVQAHPFFQRRGKNLEVALPVTLGEAARGAKVDVPTPKGVISLRVPAGTSSGTRLRVKGHGVSSKGDEPGDLFAVIQITIPKTLDQESIELIDKLDQHWNAQHQQNPRRDLRW